MSKNNLLPLLLLSTLLIGGVLGACKKDLTPEEQLMEDIDSIRQLLEEQMLTAVSTPSGLHYIITEPGTGGSPNLQSNVKVNYKGYLLDGTVFDEGNATFLLANLIQGWQEAVPLLQKGGKGTFLMPSALGYGPNDVGPIPANSVLIFDIELLDFF